MYDKEILKVRRHMILNPLTLSQAVTPS